MDEAGARGERRTGAGSGLRGPETIEQRREARAAADRHSRRVRTFKIALPALGIGAILLIGGYTWVKMHFLPGFDVRNVLFTNEGLTMVEPRLTGRTEGRTYDVAAVKAFQHIDNPKIIRLEGIDGQLEMEGGVTSKIESGEGLYDGTKETLALIGGVTVTTSNGWRANGETADVDLTLGNIRATKGVRIFGPSTTIESDTLDLTESGHHAVFTGNVHMTVQPGVADPAEAGSPQTTSVTR